MDGRTMDERDLLGLQPISSHSHPAQCEVPPTEKAPIWSVSAPDFDLVYCCDVKTNHPHVRVTAQRRVVQANHVTMYIPRVSLGPENLYMMHDVAKIILIIMISNIFILITGELRVPAGRVLARYFVNRKKRKNYNRNESIRIVYFGFESISWPPQLQFYLCSCCGEKVTKISHSFNGRRTNDPVSRSKHFELRAKRHRGDEIVGWKITVYRNIWKSLY